MSQMTLPRIEPPGALHRAEADLPFVTFFEGLDFQLLQASVENGLWIETYLDLCAKAGHGRPPVIGL